MLRLCLLAVFALTLAACAGPNGAAYGNNRGGMFSADILRIPLPN